MQGAAGHLRADADALGPGGRQRLRPPHDARSLPEHPEAPDPAAQTPPNANIPAEHDGDPHEDPRREPGGALQKAVFLYTGLVIDVCDGQPYRTDDHPDSGGGFVCNP